MSDELPVPEKSLVAQPFWDGLETEELRIQYCETCDEHIFPPKAACPDCLGMDLEWIESDGCGTVYTFSVVRVPMSERWEDRIPYVNAIVNLEGNAHIFSNVVNVPLDDVHVGMDVDVTFCRKTESMVLPEFEPA